MGKTSQGCSAAIQGPEHVQNCSHFPTSVVMLFIIEKKSLPDVFIHHARAASTETTIYVCMHLASNKHSCICTHTFFKHLFIFGCPGSIISCLIGHTSAFYGVFADCSLLCLCNQTLWFLQDKSKVLQGHWVLVYSLHRRPRIKLQSYYAPQ